jgi:hypothetical protein
MPAQAGTELCMGQDAGKTRVGRLALAQRAIVAVN